MSQSKHYPTMSVVWARPLTLDEYYNCFIYDAKTYERKISQKLFKIKRFGSIEVSGFAALFTVLVLGLTFAGSSKTNKLGKSYSKWWQGSWPRPPFCQQWWEALVRNRSIPWKQYHWTSKILKQFWPKVSRVINWIAADSTSQGIFHWEL